MSIISLTLPPPLFSTPFCLLPCLSNPLRSFFGDHPQRCGFTFTEVCPSSFSFQFLYIVQSSRSFLLLLFLVPYTFSNSLFSRLLHPSSVLTSSYIAQSIFLSHLSSSSSSTSHKIHALHAQIRNSISLTSLPSHSSGFVLSFLLLSPLCHSSLLLSLLTSNSV